MLGRMMGPDPELTARDAPFELPGAGAIIGRGFDLTLTASSQVRRASVYIGLLLVAVVGPAVLLMAVMASTAPSGIETLFADVERWAESAQLGTFDRASGAWLSAAVLLGVLFVGALAGILVISVEAQIVGVAVLGGQLVGRPVTLRDALARSRQTFWRVTGATLLAAIPVQVVQLVIARGLAGSTIPAEGVTLITTLAVTPVAAPFGYLLTGIVLGDVGATEAISRSIRLARTRWRLALVIALFPAVFSSVQLFALAAGGDVVARLAAAVGLGFGTDLLRGTLTLGVILAAIAAVGSLVLTMSAILAAPQVVAFIGLTHYAGGLEVARAATTGTTATTATTATTGPGPSGGASPPAQAAAAPPPGTPVGWSSEVAPERFRWVTRPMLAGIIAMGAMALAGVAVLLRF